MYFNYDDYLRQMPPFYGIPRPPLQQSYQDVTLPTQMPPVPRPPFQQSVPRPPQQLNGQFAYMPVPDFDDQFLKPGMRIWFTLPSGTYTGTVIQAVGIGSVLVQTDTGQTMTVDIDKISAAGTGAPPQPVGGGGFGSGGQNLGGLLGQIPWWML